MAFLRKVELRGLRLPVRPYFCHRFEQAVMEIISVAASKRDMVFMCFRLSIFVVSLLVYDTSIGGEP